MSEVEPAFIPRLPSYIDVGLHHDIGITKPSRPATAAAMAFGVASTGTEWAMAHGMGSRSQIGLQRFEDVDGNTSRALVEAAHQNCVGQHVGPLDLDRLGSVLVQWVFPVGECIGVVVDKVYERGADEVIAEVVVGVHVVVRGQELLG